MHEYAGGLIAEGVRVPVRTCVRSGLQCFLGGMYGYSAVWLILSDKRVDLRWKNCHSHENNLV